MRKCIFIGTPYAIEELLDVERNTKFQNPLAQTHLHAVYDVKKALKPYINEAITHYQVVVIDIITFNIISAFKNIFFDNSFHMRC